eukprot:CAMPEP_0118851760 /NCGR_PEP_ID=MMETSP1163-20130328/1079_1 /TAXON_ID=124430 /ORGANISM="Phaeomonas parva, Strain CCMP2877" /LENGTH=225 /DNA_ID=CAMNT_0006784145 /DNA_START=70 /DNA_END=744 /DNA_ORIENTATION=-
MWGNLGELASAALEQAAKIKDSIENDLDNAVSESSTPPRRSAAAARASEPDPEPEAVEAVEESEASAGAVRQLAVEGLEEQDEASEEKASEAAYRARLVAFYEEHNPAKLAQVDAAMAALRGKYRGREEKFFATLERKYARAKKAPPADAGSPPTPVPPMRKQLAEAPAAAAEEAEPAPATAGDAGDRGAPAEAETEEVAPERSPEDVAPQEDESPPPPPAADVE